MASKPWEVQQHFSGFFAIFLPRCPLIVESFKYDTSEMSLQWLVYQDGSNQTWPVGLGKTVQLDSWTLMEIERPTCHNKHDPDSRACLQLNFVLRRKIGHFVVKVASASVAWFNVG